MNSDTEHNPAYAGKPINNSVNFCETVHVVTSEEREAANDQIAALAESVKKDINERHQ